VRVQEDHHLALGTLLRPRVSQGLRALVPEPRHLRETLGVLVQDRRRLVAELLDDALREHGPDPFREPGAEELLEPLHGLRDKRQYGEGLQLPAELRILAVTPRGADARSRRDGLHLAHDRDALPVRVRDPQHAKARLRVLVGDAIDLAFDDILGVVGGHPGQVVESSRHGRERWPGGPWFVKCRRQGRRSCDDDEAGPHCRTDAPRSPVASRDASA